MLTLSLLLPLGDQRESHDSKKKCIVIMKALVDPYLGKWVWFNTMVYNVLPTEESHWETLAPNEQQQFSCLREEEKD